MKDMGYPIKEPCDVCGLINENQTDSWFGHVVCKKHRWVPPAYISLAIQEYITTGKTQWDTDDE